MNRRNYLFSFALALFFIAGVFLSTGCADDASEIPSFIKIDTVIVDSVNYSEYGSIRHKINFAFVYIDDNLQGAYLLPAKFPVIGEGPKNITIYAGVAEFGNGSTITRYMFYTPYKISDTLVLQDTLPLIPHVQYDTNSFVVREMNDFDGMSDFNFVQTSTSGNYIPNFSDTDSEAEGLAGYMYMGTGDTVTTVCSIESDVITVPKNGVGYFLEIDYKCNAPFFFDIKTSTGYRSIIGFNTKTTWNKAYINITYAIDVTPGTDVRLIFKTNRDVNIPNQEILIDNIKLIYLP